MEKYRHVNWEDKIFVVGATYRVIEENTNGRKFCAGEEWVFWYNTYSRYDNLAFAFFVMPESFYPPAGARVPTELKEAVSVGWEVDLTMIINEWWKYWELVEGPRQGRMWVMEAWQRMRKVAEEQYQARLKYTDERTQPPQPPEWPPRAPG